MNSSLKENNSNNKKYNPVSEEIIEELNKIVDSERIISEETAKIPYSMDGTLYNKSNIPELVIQPINALEICEIMKLANKYLIPVTPRGSGTSLSGGPLSIYGGILLDMTLMNKIESISIENNIVIVEPGVICDDLNFKLSKYDYFFPPDPGSSSAATIGGMVGNNAGGIQAFKYGVTSNYVLWLEVVLPDGKLVEFGSKTLKSTSSLNLTSLMVGSEGVLGIVTKIALKIRPKPKDCKSSFYIYNSFEKIVNAIISIRKIGILPNMVEFLDRITTEVCFNYLGGEYLHYPKGYFFLLEIDGTSEQVEAQFKIAHQLCLNQIPIFYKITQKASDREDIIRARKSALPALSRLAPTTSIEDCTINITELNEAVLKIEKISEKYDEKGIKIATFGHLEGNLHPTFLFNEQDEFHKKLFENAVDELYREVVLPLGGTITGEHGVGIVKAPFIRSEHGNVLEIMHSIKNLLDPNQILNPGKAKGSKRLKYYSNPINLPQKDDSTIPPINCMRCGFCVNSCPSYQEFRKEMYSPRGKLSIIKAITLGNIKMTPLFRNVLYSCSLCGSCQVKCPALIDTIDLFEAVRELIYSPHKN